MNNMVNSTWVTKSENFLFKVYAISKIYYFYTFAEANPDDTTIELLKKVKADCISNNTIEEGYLNS